MLTFNLKHPFIKNNFLVEDTYDLESLKEQFIGATAKSEIKKLIETAKKLGASNPNFDSTKIIKKLRGSIHTLAEDLSNDESFDWLEGVEIIPLGTPCETELFVAARSNGLGCSFHDWLEQVNDLDTHDMAKLYWLVVYKGYELDDSISKLADTSVYCDTLRATAEQIFDELYFDQLPDKFQPYSNYDRYANDLRAGSDLCEFKFANQTWTAENR